MKAMDERYLAAVDLGTSTVRLCVGHVSGNDIQIEYFKEVASEGIRSSVIFNPQLVTDTVGSLVRDAEAALMARITGVVVGLPRKDVAEITASMKLNRPDPDEYISRGEIEELKELALDTYPLPLPDKQEIYSAVAQYYEIDDALTLPEKEVDGTLGSTIEGRFKVFVGRRQATAALDKVFHKLGIAVVRRYFLPEVVPPVVLTEVERTGGVAIVDIGSGVTSVAVYKGGVLRHYASIPFGGDTVTGDIRTECVLPEDLAEKIKVRFGTCLPDRLGGQSEKVLDVRVADPPMEIPVKFLSEIVDSRYREILEAVLYLIQESGEQDSLRSGIVLVGGGAEQTHLDSLLKELSGYRVRKGKIRNLFTSAVGKAVLSTKNASVLGLLVAAKDMGAGDCLAFQERTLRVDESQELEETVSEPQDTLAELEGTVSDPQGTIGAPEVEPGLVKTLKGQLKIIWKTIENKALAVYDYLNSET